MLRFIFILQMNQVIFGSQEKPKMQMTKEETEIFCNLYCSGSPWKIIREKYVQFGLDINALMDRWMCPSMDIGLTYAIDRNKFKLAYEMLNNKDINVSYRNINGETALHILARKHPSDDSKLYCRVAETLILRGCPINTLDNHEKRPCLGNFYAFNKEWDKGLAIILIKNGALLKINEGDKQWNIFNNFIYILNHSDYFNCSEDYNYPFYQLENSFFRVFNRDHDTSFKKSFFTTALIFNRLKKSNKGNKIVMPKVLVKYIASFCTDPIVHIEETIGDAWNRLELSKLLNKELPQEVRAFCGSIERFVTPGSWKQAWINYRGGDRSKHNLIVKALEYVKNDKK